MFGLLKIFFKFYNRFFSPDKLFAKRLRSLVGFTPSNIGIFKLAFYHKSASSEKLYAVQSNERLEYLGDAVLGTIVAEYLFKKYPQKDEGFLTKMRSKIVKRQSLNKIADKMGLDVFLNQYNNTRLSRSMLGNALEALVGAVYIERGYNQTRQYVIQKILRGYLDIHELESFDDNYKSQLLEWCQKNGQTVSYKMLAKYKFEKRDRFKVAVLIDGKKLAAADDFNKKSAEQTASEKAMQILGLLKEEKEENGDQRKPRNNSRNPRSYKPREERNTRRDDRNKDSKSRKPQARKQDKQAAKPSPAAKEDSDWSDVKLDLPESTSKITKDAKGGSKNSRPVRSSRSNSNKKKNENTAKTQEKNQAKGDSKSESQTTEKSNKPKQENKRKPAARKPRPQVAKKEDGANNNTSESKKVETEKAVRKPRPQVAKKEDGANGNTSESKKVEAEKAVRKPRPQVAKKEDGANGNTSESKKVETEKAPRKPRPQVAKKEEQAKTNTAQEKNAETEKTKAPRIVKKRVEKSAKELPQNKKETQQERASDQVDAVEPVKVREPKTKTENAPRRNNSQRSRGNASTKNRNTQNIDTEESVEIEIPVDLSQGIVEKVKPQNFNTGSEAGEDSPIV